jgi:hypothetical protein
MAAGEAIPIPALRDWASRIGLPLTEAELPVVALEIGAGEAALASLRRVDLGGLEPIVILDPDRGL